MQIKGWVRTKELITKEHASAHEEHSLRHKTTALPADRETSPVPLSKHGDIGGPSPMHI